jgi:elongation factor Ts
MTSKKMTPKKRQQLMSNMKLIKKLRDTTGSGIVDCKKALLENNDDIEASIKWLREKGILKAQKKQDRETNEGVISLFNHDSSHSSFSLCKIKCETDFVAKNDDFLNFAHSLTKSIFENNEIEKSGSSENLSKVFIGDKDLNTALTDLISKIGENIQIVSYKKYNSDNSIFVSYLHNKYNSSCSKIVSIVEISTNDVSKTVGLIDQLKVIAMQVSAMKPMSLDEKSLDKKILDDERDIILKQIENTPEDKKEMIIKGKLSKFIKENTLLGQSLITDPKNTVSNYLNEISKSSNLDLNIISMDLYTI